jgi:hypothetical protein
VTEIEVHFSGPMFDGRAAHAMAELVKDVRKDVADRAEAVWQEKMTASFRHSTGRYQSFVNIAERDKDLVVNDGWPESRLEYGPWLEGIGSRNSPVTRFPGYFALKRAFEEVKSQVEAIAKPAVDKRVAEANG